MKIAKKGVFKSIEPRVLMWRAYLTWRGADVACATTARMQRGSEATWQGRGWPTRGAQSADTWQEATRVHAGLCRRPCGVPRGTEVNRWRAHGYSGPW